MDQLSHRFASQAEAPLRVRFTHLASAFALVAGLGMPTTGALAQAQVTPIPPQVSPPPRNQLIPPEQRREERSVTLTIDGDLERAPCVLDRAEYSDIRLTLTGVEFSGLDRVPGLSLSSAYDGYLNRELPLAVLCDIRAQANSILRSKGYLATVEIPEQNLSDGVADFGVVFGRLTGLRVRGDAGPSEAVVAAYLEKLTEQPVFNTNDAERYLLLADDLPGVNVRLSLRPAAGGAPGDLTGEIAVVRQYGAIDLNIQNFGSKAIGRFGGLLRVEAYDLTGLGDRTSVALFSTVDFVEQQTVQLAHDFAIGGDGLRLGAQLTYSETSPDLNLPNVDLQSETVLATVQASYPLKRSRRSSIFASAGVDIVDQSVDFNQLQLTRDRVRTMFVRLSGDWTDERSIQRLDGYSAFEPKMRFRYGVEARHGLGIFSASPDCRSNPLVCVAGAAVPPSRIEADPTPFLMRYDAGFEFRPDPRITFSLSASAQVTSDPLPAFEEYAGGSFSIGRGYDPGSVLGDNGLSVAMELRYGSMAPAGPDAVAVQPYVFSDFVRTWNEDPSRSPLNPDRLWSAGGGVRAAWGSKLQGDAFLAVPLQRPDLAPQLGDVRFMVSVTARLLPWRF
ncbi:MAG: ShlB/FhaC/HecB family hemolysin secretion/activation protein [Erythrobacter sp.]|uniref:ShlB/FhaC/HecB family hemolysin secretion/activation protein n=1 Tax=Erythrobacter sp. TaxID=1042 RepID=UPI003A835879